MSKKNQCPCCGASVAFLDVFLSVLPRVKCSVCKTTLEYACRGIWDAVLTALVGVLPLLFVAFCLKDIFFTFNTSVFITVFFRLLALLLMLIVSQLALVQFYRVSHGVLTKKGC